MISWTKCLNGTSVERTGRKRSSRSRINGNKEMTSRLNHGTHSSRIRRKSLSRPKIKQLHRRKRTSKNLSTNLNRLKESKKEMKVTVSKYAISILDSIARTFGWRSSLTFAEDFTARCIPLFSWRKNFHHMKKSNTIGYFSSLMIVTKRSSYLPENLITSNQAKRIMMNTFKRLSSTLRVT